MNAAQMLLLCQIFCYVSLHFLSFLRLPSSYRTFILHRLDGSWESNVHNIILKEFKKSRPQPNKRKANVKKCCR